MIHYLSANDQSKAKLLQPSSRAPRARSESLPVTSWRLNLSHNGRARDRVVKRNSSGRQPRGALLVEEPPRLEQALCADALNLFAPGAFILFACSLSLFSSKKAPCTEALSSEKRSVEADQEASTSPFKDKVALSSELTFSMPSEMLLIAEARWRANFTRQNPVPKERAC